jgi:hypothetical protein
LAVLTWSDLLPEQKCVLVEAAKSGLLQDVLTSWAPGDDWTRRLSYVPRLAQAIIDLVAVGLVEVYQSISLEDEDELVFDEDLPAVVQDPANWMTDDGPRKLVELVSTTVADDVFKSRSGEGLYDFRRQV